MIPCSAKIATELKRKCNVTRQTTSLLIGGSGPHRLVKRGPLCCYLKRVGKAVPVEGECHPSGQYKWQREGATRVSRVAKGAEMDSSDLFRILPRVLIVSRRTVRKNKFVDFVGKNPFVCTLQ